MKGVASLFVDLTDQGGEGYGYSRREAVRYVSRDESDRGSHVAGEVRARILSGMGKTKLSEVVGQGV